VGTCLVVAFEVGIRPIAVAVLAAATAEVDIAGDKTMAAMVATVVAMYPQEVAVMVVVAFAIADWIAVVDTAIAVGTHFLAVADKAVVAVAIVDSVDLARIDLVVTAVGIVTRVPSFLVEKQ